MRARFIYAPVVMGLLALMALPAAAEERRSGYDEMSVELQAMQNDPMANPAMFSILAGEALFSTPMGTKDQACADCHDAGDMAGAAASYPAWDAQSGQAVDLTGRIGLCRARYQNAPEFAPESPDLVALLSYVTSLSAGLPISPRRDPDMVAVREAGAALFNTRMGQLNLSCAQCHEERAGGYLRAALIPQAHPTGYPQYRLEWEDVGTLERRLGNCMTGVRAERFGAGSPEIVALTAYLMERAAGMAIESPALRP